MLRVVVTNFVLFALPFIIYGAFMVLVRGRHPAKMLDDAPVLWLLAAGGMLAAIMMFYFMSYDYGSPEGRYVPPTVKDGVVVPGHFE